MIDNNIAEILQKLALNTNQSIKKWLNIGLSYVNGNFKSKMATIIGQSSHTTMGKCLIFFWLETTVLIQTGVVIE